VVPLYVAAPGEYEIEPVSLPLSQLEGKYDILHKIKEGGMGAIYLVRHLLLEETRVIKVIRPQFAADDNVQRRFLREAKTAIRLRHANIAQIYDFAVSDEDGTSFIVMEYIEGVTLQEVLRKSGPPPVQLALEVAHQGLSALAYLHHQGFIHRDISSDNLMLARDFRGAPLVKLIDLGIAKQVDSDLELTQTGMFMGKVRYAPPEQFSGSEGGGPEQDQRSDVYSFGILLYELFTGCCPIVGESVSELIASHLFNSPLSFAKSDPQGRLPSQLRAVLLRALEKSPEDRFADADEFIEALAPFRVAGEVLSEDLDRVLQATASAAEETEDDPRAGSTQSRLNRQFNPVTTPSPTAVQTLIPTLETEPQPVAPPPARPSEQAEASTPDAVFQEFPSWVTEVAFVQELIEQGELVRAEERLSETEAAHGDSVQWAELRQQLETRRGESIAVAERSIASALTDGQLDLAVREIDFARARYGDQPELQTLRVRADQLRAALAIGSAEPMAEISDLEISHSSHGLTHDDSPPPKRSSRLPWVAAAVLVVAIVGGYFWWQRMGHSTDAANPVAATDEAVAVSTAGTLVLNALPWARVESITDATGTPFPVGPEPHTPLRLALPPGRYQVALVNPRTASRQVVEVEIRAAATTRTTVELAPVDVERYLARVLSGARPPGSR